MRCPCKCGGGGTDWAARTQRDATARSMVFQTGRRTAPLPRDGVSSVQRKRAGRAGVQVLRSSHRKQRRALLLGAASRERVAGVCLSILRTRHAVAGHAAKIGRWHGQRDAGKLPCRGAELIHCKHSSPTACRARSATLPWLFLVANMANRAGRMPSGGCVYINSKSHPMLGLWRTWKREPYVEMSALATRTSCRVRTRLTDAQYHGGAIAHPPHIAQECVARHVVSVRRRTTDSHDGLRCRRHLSATSPRSENWSRAGGSGIWSTTHTVIVELPMWDSHLLKGLRPSGRLSCPCRCAGGCFLPCRQRGRAALHGCDL